MWGVMLPGFAQSTWPRSISSFSTPRRSATDVVAGLTLVEELAEHLDAVTTVFFVLKPMMLTSSLTLMTPRSMRPGHRAARPLIENTSSIAISGKGLSMSRTGSWM